MKTAVSVVLKSLQDSFDAAQAKSKTAEAAYAATGSSDALRTWGELAGCAHALALAKCAALEALRAYHDYGGDA